MWSMCIREFYSDAKKKFTGKWTHPESGIRNEETQTPKTKTICSFSYTDPSLQCIHIHGSTHTCMHRKMHMWEYMWVKPKTLEESKRGQK